MSVHHERAESPGADAGPRPAPDAWLKSGEYLPPFMRDFHDQKDLFKALDEVAQRSVENGNDYLRDLTFSAAQIYTIDIFLWCLARRGWTLQRSRSRLAFADLQEFIAEAKARRDAESIGALRSIFAARPPHGAPLRDHGEEELAAQDDGKTLSTREEEGGEPLAGRSDFHSRGEVGE